MRLHDCNGDSKKAYKSIGEAIHAYENKYGEDSYKSRDGFSECSLGVGIDEEGKYWFIVDSANMFANCKHEDLMVWSLWYEIEWIEKEE